MTESDLDPSNNSELTALYRNAARELPSASADAEILAAAHRAVGSKPKWSDATWGNWAVTAFAAAAIAVLAVGITRMMSQDEISKVPADPGHAAEKATVVQPSGSPEPVDIDTIPQPLTHATPAITQGINAAPPSRTSLSPAGGAFVNREQSLPPPAAASAPPGSAIADAVEESTASAVKSLSRSASSSAMQVSPKPTADRDPITWIAAIRALRKRGQGQAATLELQAFRHHYPDYELPQDLRDRP